MRKPVTYNRLPCRKTAGSRLWVAGSRGGRGRSGETPETPETGSIIGLTLRSAV